jgi:hypothetical protein
MHIYSAIFAALLLLSPTLADFHIGQIMNVAGSAPNPPTNTEYIACPSNYYNCNCFGSKDRAVNTYLGQNPASATFSLNSGLCGMGQLDFYYQDSKKGWDFYVNGGDGSLQGTCYPNSDTQWCAIPLLWTTKYTDNLVCYSYICGQ